MARKIIMVLAAFLLAGTMVSAQELVISPADVTVEVGETVNFTATEYDIDNNIVDTPVFWSLAGDVGTMEVTGDASMVFTATAAGTCGLSALGRYSVANDAVITVVEPEPEPEAETPQIKGPMYRIRAFFLRIRRMIMWWLRSWCRMR